MKIIIKQVQGKIFNPDIEDQCGGRHIFNREEIERKLDMNHISLQPFACFSLRTANIAHCKHASVTISGFQLNGYKEQLRHFKKL